MPAKKSTKQSNKKKSSGITVTEKEKAAWARQAEADMKKHGFKTVDELIAYYDSKRGY